MSIRLEDDASLLIRSGWNAGLQEESQEADILTALTGTYSTDIKTIPDSVIMEVAMGGMNSMAIGLLMDLNGAGTQGDGVVTTEKQILKQLVIKAANVRHGVNNDMFGREASLLEYYGMIDRANGQIGKWMKARKGKHYRQAMVENISDNLTLAPHSLTAFWNRHILGKNLTDAQQPAYSSTLNTYTSNLYTAIGNAGTTSSAMLNAGFFAKLAYYVTAVWKIKPLNDGTYIVLVPSRQKANLMNLSDTTSLASLQRTTLSEKYDKLAFGGVMGQIGPFILVEDARAPILVRDTSAVNVTAYYRDIGDTDVRANYTNAGSTLVYDAIPVLGQGAVAVGTMMKLRYDDELSDVGRVRQLVASQTYGVKAIEFDSDTVSSTSKIGQNMALAFAYSGSITS